MSAESWTDARSVPDDVEARVLHIVGLMERLEWVRGKTLKTLARAWGCSESSVKNYSAEASRRITANEDEARRDISLGCRKLFKQAVDEGDPKGARAVGELWAQVSGAKAPEKREHKVTGVGLDDLDALRKSAEANDDTCSTSSSESEPSS